MKRLDRMAAYTRYLELLQAQHDALVAGDLEGFAGLAAARDEVALLADTLPPAPDAAAARALLGRCLEVDFSVRERLSGMRDDARNHLQHMEVRRPRLVPYLAAQGAAARLDRVS